MTNGQRGFTLGLIVGLVVLLAVVGPYLRRDTASVDAAIARELNSEASLNWDGPLLRLLTQPVPRVVSYDQQKQVAVVGMYSWFGVRVGRVTLEGCQPGKSGNVNAKFACVGGGMADYGMW